jgi:hypothetical protein
VLREDLANLTSSDFYNTDKRLTVAADTLKVLNEELAPLHLEAQAVLVRAVTFRPEYEVQLQAIQLNEQNKLLDGARQRVAQQQQELDNFELQTTALANARQQDWVKRQADLERVYQVGFVVDPKDDRTPGTARRVLKALSEEEVGKLREEAAKLLEIDDIGQDQRRVPAGDPEHPGRDPRVQAAGHGLGRRHRGPPQGRGRGRHRGGPRRLRDQDQRAARQPGRPRVRGLQVGRERAVQPDLTFQSREGIPSVLRLRSFALQFMGGG